MRADLLTNFMCKEVGTPFTSQTNRKNVFIECNGKVYDVGNCFSYSDSDVVILKCGDDLTEEYIKEYIK